MATWHWNLQSGSETHECDVLRGGTDRRGRRSLTCVRDGRDVKSIPVEYTESLTNDRGDALVTHDGVYDCDTPLEFSRRTVTGTCDHVVNGTSQRFFDTEKITEIR